MHRLRCGGAVQPHDAAAHPLGPLFWCCPSFGLFYRIETAKNLVIADLQTDLAELQVALPRPAAAAQLCAAFSAALLLAIHPP